MKHIDNSADQKMFFSPWKNSPHLISDFDRQEYNGNWVTILEREILYKENFRMYLLLTVK